MMMNGQNHFKFTLFLLELLTILIYLNLTLQPAYSLINALDYLGLIKCFSVKLAIPTTCRSFGFLSDVLKHRSRISALRFQRNGLWLKGTMHIRNGEKGFSIIKSWNVTLPYLWTDVRSICTWHELPQEPVQFRTFDIAVTWNYMRQKIKIQYFLRWYFICMTVGFIVVTCGEYTVELKTKTPMSIPFNAIFIYTLYSTLYNHWYSNWLHVSTY